MKIAIVTAIYDEYDALKDQPTQITDHQVDYICFADRKLVGYPWEVIVGRRNGRVSARRQAKRFKVLVFKQRLLKTRKYDYVVWVDGSAVIKTPKFVDEVLQMIDKDSVMCFKHPEGRDCIYQEAEYCRNMSKYVHEPIDEQVANYRNMNYPAHNGLFACGMMVYKMSSAALGVMLDSWWDEIVTWSIQDQISFPYAAWSTNTPINAIQFSQYDNHLIEFRMHEHKSKY